MRRLEGINFLADSAHVHYVYTALGDMTVEFGCLEFDLIELRVDCVNCFR